MDSNQAVMAPAEAGKAEKRTPRSVRFHDPGWERIEAFAEERGMAAAEFIRFAALDAIEGGAAADEDGDRLDPLIERTFRYSYMMATKMRDDMRAVDRGEELEVLIPELRKPVQRNSMRDARIVLELGEGFRSRGGRSVPCRVGESSDSPG